MRGVSLRSLLRSCARGSVLGWMSVAACGGVAAPLAPEPKSSGEGASLEDPATAPLRSQHSGVWQAYGERTFTLSGTASPALNACGVYRPLDEGRPVTLCFHVELDSTVPGAGPMTLAIEDTAQVPSQQSSSPSFTPGPGQASGVRATWVKLECFALEPIRTTTQQVRGQLVLTENSASRFTGHLALTSEGELAGACGGEAAVADLDFTVTRP